jgi:fluoride exporter
MTRFLLICFGGALGTGARYLLGGWTLKAFGAAFPYGTLAVNVLGSFFVAALMYLGVEAAAIPPLARVVLTTGVMGGFTTYSTFSFETMKYFQDGAWGLGILNVVVTVVGCLVACLFGWAGARWMVGP